jgi:hypothetical protein
VACCLGAVLFVCDVCHGSTLLHSGCIAFARLQVPLSRYRTELITACAAGGGVANELRTLPCAHLARACLQALAGRYTCSARHRRLLQRYVTLKS